MPPPLPTESQLRRNEEELVHDAPAHGLTTSPEDETEDEDEPPVIAESSEPAKSEDVAAEAAARSLSLQSEHPAQPRKRKSPVLPRKDPYIVSDDEPLRKRTRASTTAQDDRDDTKGSPDPKKSPPGSNVEDKGNDHDEQPKAASDGSTVKSTDSKDEVTEVSEDEIVVARPSSRSKKSTQPSSSAGLSSTPTPTPFRACPFLHTPSRTILLSHLSPDADTKKCLRKQGVTIKDDAKPRDNFLCVVEEKKSQGLESIPTTFKVMKTLLAKKLVVSESWMLESIEDDELLDPSSYVVVDGRDCDRSSLYSGLTVFFTSKAVEGGFAKLKTLATQAGATRVKSGKATKGMQLTPRTSVIFLAAKDDDPAGAALAKENCRVYERSLLTKSILRGDLDLESGEFRLS